MQYMQFKEHEIPLKENEKTKIKNLYKMLEVQMQNSTVGCFDHTLQFSPSYMLVVYLTDVDRVWTYSVTPGSSPKRCGEGMG